jgi:hypothetical protein
MTMRQSGYPARRPPPDRDGPHDYLVCLSPPSPQRSSPAASNVPRGPLGGEFEESLENLLDRLALLQGKA